MTTPAAQKTHLKITPEIQLVLACASSAVSEESVARINELIDGGIDWDAFVVKARSHRVDIIPLLHHNLSAPGVRAPAAILDKLRDWHHQLASFTLHNVRALCQIVEALEERGIPALPFKGPTLAAFAYKDVLLRTSRDLDILVHKSDFARAQATLESMGYKHEEEHPPRASAYFFDCGFGVRMDRSDGPISIELHWTLMPDLASFPIDYDRLWRRSTTIDLLGRKVPMFAPEDLLLYVCAHANWPGHLWIKLRWICDIAEFTRCGDEFDWDALFDNARETRATRLLLLGLHLAHRLIPNTVLPPAVAQRMAREPGLERMGETVENWIFGKTAVLPRNFTRVRFYVGTRENLRDRILDRLNLWSNDTQLIRALALPRRLNVLYWVLGPLWKAGRHVMFIVTRTRPASTRVP